MLNAHTEDQDGKNIAIIYCKDTSGCSHVRLRYNAEYINGYTMGVIPTLMPYPTFDPVYLSRAKSIIFQRPITDSDVQILTRYKELQPKFGYKLVAEFDDLVFMTGEGKDDGVPSYNPGHDTIVKHIDKSTKNLQTNIDMCDMVIASTPFIAVIYEPTYLATWYAYVSRVSSALLFPSSLAATKSLKSLEIPDIPRTPDFLLRIEFISSIEILSFVLGNNELSNYLQNIQNKNGNNEKIINKNKLITPLISQILLNIVIFYHKILYTSIVIHKIRQSQQIFHS